MRVEKKEEEGPTSMPIRGTFFVCCASARLTEARAKLTSKTTMVFIAIRACLLRFIAGCPEPFSLPREVGITTVHWEQRLPCFLWDMLLARGGLLIDG